MAAHTERPWARTFWPELPLPRVRPQLPASPHGSGPGRPPRDPLEAREVAIAWDLDYYRPDAEEDYIDHVTQKVRARGGMGRERALVAITHARDTWDSRTERNWRDHGRRQLAIEGAWPWALRQDGKLERTWWTHPRYFEKLNRWAESG